MRRRAEGIVEEITAGRPGAQEIVVRLDAGQEIGSQAAPDKEAGDRERRRALNIDALTGTVSVGDRVLLNTVAVEMGLGTGGLDFVVAILGDSSSDPPPGHVIKLRYTPMQTPVLAVEAPESPYHARLCRFTSLNHVPVVCAELHSQIPAVCAAAKWALQAAGRQHPPRIAYVMTDGAALPLALSRLIPQMKAIGLLDATITAGQAFGGDYEAVNLYSALVAAREVVGADIIVVGQGPGNVGTGTPFGFSGIDQGIAINAAAALQGVPIAVARISFADPRERHYGLSHHTITVLQRVAQALTLVPIPRLPESQMQVLRTALEGTGIDDHHQPITIDADQALAALEQSGLAVTTMGRSIAEERPFFLAAAAAGVLAAQLIEAHHSQ